MYSASHGADAGVLAVAFSPDGKTVAAVDEAAKVILYNATEPRQTTSLDTGMGGLGRQIMSLDLLSPEEKKLLLNKDPRQQIHSGAVAFSPDGQTLAVGGGPVVKLLDVATGRPQRALEDKTLIEVIKKLGENSEQLDRLAAVPHAHGYVESVAFSPDGTLLATSGGHIIEASGATPGHVKLWDAKTGELKRDLGEHFGGVRSVAFSPDGKIMASAGTHTPRFTSSVRFWDPQTGTVKRVLSISRGDPWSVAFSPDGRLVACGGIVSEPYAFPGMLSVWNALTGTLLRHRILPRPVASLAFSPDGRTLATGEDRRGVTLWDPETLEPKSEIKPATDVPRDLTGTVCVAFSPSGNLLAIGAKNERHGFVTIWEIGEPEDSPASADSLGAGPRPDETAKFEKTLDEALELIGENYFTGVDRPELTESAIRGMLDKLDQHSDYISQVDLMSLHEELTHKLSGIGLSLRYDRNARQLLVVTPFPETPAYKAGVRAGDTIVQIDGKPTSDLPEGKELQTAAKLLRGRPGEAVTIGLKRSGSDTLEKIRIVRATLRLPTVLGDTHKPDGSWNFMLDDEHKIGYVRLANFGPRTAKELEDVLGNLKSKGMKALVIDLRNNPGGLLSQAVQVSDLFVGSGTILTIKGQKSPARAWIAKKEGTLSGFPMAVLVNSTSAGASEIVAACLQDHKRATIVGQRTYGKGSAQTIVKLSGDEGALKLTTAVFLRPNGENIQRLPGAKESDQWGVMPDAECEVELSKEELKEYVQYRQQRDIFPAEGPPRSDFEDRQLQKATDCLLKR